MKKRNFLILLLLLNQSISGRIFIRAGKKTKTTFDFPVSCSVYNSGHQVAWLGAGENINGDDAEYAISVARHMAVEGSSKYGEAQPIISPRATEKANLFTNSVKKPFYPDVKNPLYGSACKLMVLYTTIPIVVLKDSPSDLYLLSEIFVDEQQQRTGSSSISRFSFHKDEIIHKVIPSGNFLYVFHSQNEFGQDDTSRVTVLQVNPGQGIKDEKDKPFVFHTFTLKASRKIDKSDLTLMGSAGIPLTSFGPEICGKGEDNQLKVALSVTANPVGTACGLIKMGVRSKKVEENKEAEVVTNDEAVVEDLEKESKESINVEEPVNVEESLDEVKDETEESQKESLESENLISEDETVEADLVDANQEAVELSEENSESEAEAEAEAEAVVEEVEDKDLPETFEIDDDKLISEIFFESVVAEDFKNYSSLPFYVSNGESFVAKELKSMRTSTALNYLVLTTNYDLFTFPMDRDGKIFTQGLVEDHYIEAQFSSRKIRQGGAKSVISSFTVPHKIEDIQIAGDVIYVKDNTRTGVYSYRALLDDNGIINSWSESEHFASDKKIDFFFVSTQLPFTWYGYHENNNLLFGQAMWEVSTEMTEEFIATVSQSLPQEISGVQNVISLSCNDLYETRNMIVATGYEKAVFGYMNEPNGYIDSMDVQAVSIPGAGAIVSSAVAQNIEEQQEWLLLSGVGGLYGYASTDGSGFNAIETIDDLFVDNYSWRKVGDLSFVRKVVHDNRKNDYIYLATNKGVYRLSVTKTMFTNPEIEQIFSSTILGGKFDYVSDIFIDGDFAIIGTSKGLYVITDINDSSCVPYKLELNVDFGSVSSIFAVKGSQKFDNLYVLSNNHHKQLSTLHRLVVKNKECTLFPDCMLRDKKQVSRGIKGSFLDMNTTCSSFFSNGSWSVKMNFPYKKEYEAIQCYQSSLSSGLNTLRSANRSHLRNLYLSCVEGSKNIAGMMHDRSLGCWIIFGDFGLRILS